MSEQQQTEQPEQSEQRDVLAAALTDALVREAVGLAAVAVILLLLDQRTQLWLKAAARRAWAWARADRQRPDVEHAVATLRRDISDYEASARRDGGCGCV